MNLKIQSLYELSCCFWWGFMISPQVLIVVCCCRHPSRRYNHDHIHDHHHNIWNNHKLHCHHQGANHEYNQFVYKNQGSDLPPCHHDPHFSNHHQFCHQCIQPFHHLLCQHPHHVHGHFSHHHGNSHHQPGCSHYLWCHWSSSVFELCSINSYSRGSSNNSITRVGDILSPAVDNAMVSTNKEVVTAAVSDLLPVVSMVLFAVVVMVVVPTLLTFVEVVDKRVAPGKTTLPLATVVVAVATLVAVVVVASKSNLLCCLSWCLSIQWSWLWEDHWQTDESSNNSNEQWMLGRDLRLSFWQRAMPKGCSCADFYIFLWRVLLWVVVWVVWQYVVCVLFACFVVL